MQATLEFYDVKSRRKFSSDDWHLDMKLTDAGDLRYYAVSTAPAGTHEAWRPVPASLAVEGAPGFVGERPHASQVAAFLGLKASTLGRLIEKIEQGLPYRTFEKLAGLLDLPASELGRVLGIPARTLARRKKSGILSGEESERVLRLSRLAYAAISLFEGDQMGGVAWLKRGNHALGGRTPLAMSATEIGGEEALNLIGRLEHGVFA